MMKSSGFFACALVLALSIAGCAEETAAPNDSPPAEEAVFALPDLDASGEIPLERQLREAAAECRVFHRAIQFDFLRDAFGEQMFYRVPREGRVLSVPMEQADYELLVDLAHTLLDGDPPPWATLEPLLTLLVYAEPSKASLEVARRVLRQTLPYRLTRAQSLCIGLASDILIKNGGAEAQRTLRKVVTAPFLPPGAGVLPVMMEYERGMQTLRAVAGQAADRTLYFGDPAWTIPFFEEAAADGQGTSLGYELQQRAEKALVPEPGPVVIPPMDG